MLPSSSLPKRIQASELHELNLPHYWCKGSAEGQRAGFVNSMFEFMDQYPVIVNQPERHSKQFNKF